MPANSALRRSGLHQIGEKEEAPEGRSRRKKEGSRLRQVADVILVFQGGMRVFEIAVPVLAEGPEIIIRIQAVAHFQVLGIGGFGGDGLLSASGGSGRGKPTGPPECREGNRPSVLAFHVNFPDGRVALGLGGGGSVRHCKWWYPCRARLHSRGPLNRAM